MRIKKQKLALISTSPLMMMLALRLQEDGNEVTIFDYSKNVGGAWTWFNNKYSKRYDKIPKYTNIINPYNKREVNFTSIMNNFLKKKYKIEVKQTKKKFEINYDYKKKYTYNFSKFFEFASKKLKINKKFIFKIETLANNKVRLNDKIMFDKVFIPSFSGLKKIKIYNKEVFFPDTKKIISEHLSIIAKKFKLKNFYYSQFFDNNFDRVKIEKIKKIYCLTARLDHSIKGIKITKLKRFYLDKFVKQSDLINLQISKFHNYYRNKNQLQKLMNIVKNSNIKYVDTTQFMCGFFALRKIFNVSKL